MSKGLPKETMKQTRTIAQRYGFIDYSCSLIAPADNGLKQAILEFPPEAVEAIDNVLSKEFRTNT